MDSRLTRRSWFSRIGLSALAAVGLALSASGPALGSEPIKVGHYGSMTGKEATFGQSTDNGIRLAIKEINAAGGLNGRPIELITYDTKGASQEAGNAVLRLVTQDKVVAVLGEVASSLSLAGGQVAQQYGVPMISPSSTNPRVTAGRDFVFRVCFIDPFQGYAVAKFARENLKYSKAAILYDQAQAYSRGLRDEFAKAFRAMGGEIVADQAYSSGDQDFSAQLTTIRASGAEAIFIPGYYTEAGNIALQARRLGITATLLGGDGWDSSLLSEIGKDAIEGAYYSNHYSPDQPSEAVRIFVEKYTKEFGQTPDGLAALGYDAMNLLFDAMKRAKSLSGRDLRDAIAATKNFEGVTGTISIDKDRNATKSAVIVQIRDGKPVYAATIEPASN
ncbi:ABC transporter substrate-binding protein [Leptolyngbya sp. 15MV]|nr:ABC transporter substrate-binding protein [Leptolyngbya sp. 15MV]